MSNADEYTPVAVATVGDRVVIEGHAGTVVKVQQMEGMRIVSAASDDIEADGEPSLYLEVVVD